MKKIIVPVYKLVRVLIDYILTIPLAFMCIVIIAGLWDFKFKQRLKYFKGINYMNLDEFDFKDGHFYYYKTPYDYLIGRKRERKNP